ncbi:hypothetical protein LCGC14_1182320 [marine sediment metagenome]|uniref:Uncharacterized protein n=1 Tax=marine sediment metagenome TaxID=412755 RepID=A0A0F9LRK1_9ZZZZ
MSNVIVFEGVDEVILVDAGNVNAIVREWFLNGQRNMDEYDVYLMDASEGFAITHSMKVNDGRMTDFDVTELMPHDLREGLIAANLLTRE